MTVSSEISDVSYNGDGATTTFTVPFYFLRDADLSVTIVNADGTTQAYVLGTDYTVTGAGLSAGGSITTIGTPVASVKQILIERNPPATQETAYQANDPFPAAEHEKALDKLTMLVQRVLRTYRGSLHYPITESLDGTLPQKSSRANMVLGFDPLGQHTMLPLPASVGAGDMRVDTFTAGVDFTADVTTSLTLSRATGNPANAEVFFDSTYKGPDQWSVSGTTLTFNRAIPSGVSKVFVRLGTTLSTQIPPANSVGDSQLAWGSVLGRVTNSVSDLRALDKTRYARAFLIGYYSPGDGGGGAYWYDPADNTSADNGGSVIVATDGARWKLVIQTEVSVKQFGAKGDNAADDTTKIQAALDFVGANRGLSLRFPSGKYKISAALNFRPTSALPTALTGSDLHFSEHVESYIRGDGDARIIATAAIARMLLLQFNSGLSSIGPFYTIVQGLLFDCANLATTGIESDYTMHLSILKNKIWRPVNSGIYYTGYGVAKIRDNVIKAPICINFAAGGGDSDISSNDLYPLANGRGVNIAKLAGNAVVDRNVINGEGLAVCVGVYLDGAVNASTDTIINVRVTNNEFSGMTYAIYGQRHASARNIYGVLVHGNHTIPAAGGAVHTGQLVSFTGVDDVIIGENFINGAALSATLTTAPGISLVDCKRVQVNGNKFGNLLGPAAYFKDVVIGEFCDNEINDVGQAGATGVMVDIDTGTTYLECLDNTLRQSSASFAQNPFFERAGANGNEFLRNHIFGCANRITRVGASSVVAGRVVAQGAYSLAGATATLQNNSHGFTVARTAVGVCTVTLSTGRPDPDFRVKVTADVPQAQADTFTANSFVVRTFNSGGAAVDANRVQIEVID